METVKFICEFFFGNFWHWMGLLIILLVVCDARLLTITCNKKDKNEEE